MLGVVVVAAIDDLRPTLDALRAEQSSLLAAVEELEATAGPGDTVVQPIRAYVGLQTVDGVDERAALAVEELERTGAFDRSVLVIATVTGTGWINPVAAEALEHLHHAQRRHEAFAPCDILRVQATGSEDKRRFHIITATELEHVLQHEVSRVKGHLVPDRLRNLILAPKR